MDRTRTLIEKYLAGMLEPNELAELERMLREDRAAADLFASMTRLESELHACFQQEANIQETTSGLQKAIETASVAKKGAWSRTAVWWSAAAVVLVAAGGILFSLWKNGQRAPLENGNGIVKIEPKDNPPQVDPKSTQVIAGDVRVNGQLAKTANTGDRLHVVSQQSAILSLPDGSKAEFETASEFVLRGEMAGMSQVVEMVDGTGTFKVEPAEGGFQVETPVGRVTALGTEFRVKLRTQGDVKERVFPGTKIAALAVLVISGVVEVEVAGKTYTLYAGDDRQFPAGRESGKALRETLTVLESIEKVQIVVTQGGDRPKKTTVPLTDDVRILIDGKPGRADDLGKGMMVYLQRFQGDDEVIGLRVEGPTINGSLKSVQPKDRTFTISLRKGKGSDVPDRTLALLPDTRIEIGGRPIALAELTVGSTVIVRLSVDQKSALQITVPRSRESERRK